MDNFRGNTRVKAIQEHLFEGENVFLPTEELDELRVAVLFNRMAGGIGQSISQSTGRETIKQWQRYYQVLNTLDWKILSILSFSPSFRQFALAADDAGWDDLYDQLVAQRIGIELAGAFHCRNWCDVLRVAIGPLEVGEILPGLKDYDGHHHQWCVPILDPDATNANRVVPRFEVLERSVLGKKSKLKYDPRYIKERMGEVKPCTLCRRKYCQCPSHIWFPLRTDIIEVGGRGCGIRALQASISLTVAKELSTN